MFTLTRQINEAIRRQEGLKIARRSEDDSLTFVLRGHFKGVEWHREREYYSIKPVGYQPDAATRTLRKCTIDSLSHMMPLKGGPMFKRFLDGKLEINGVQFCFDVSKDIDLGGIGRLSEIPGIKIKTHNHEFNYTEITSPKLMQFLLITRGFNLFPGYLPNFPHERDRFYLAITGIGLTEQEDTTPYEIQSKICEDLLFYEKNY